jgi:hypothetical protein
MAVDLFLSYAHADDAAYDGMADGWVTIFFENLRRRLGERGCGWATLWKDHEQVLGNAPLAGQLNDTLAQASTLVIVISPSYLTSEWCRREREAFLQAVERKVVRADSCLFVVEIDELDRQTWPAPLRDLPGYKFWDVDPRTKRPRKLGDPVPDPRQDRDYYAQLDRLAREVADELTRLRVPAAQAPASPASDASAVFLADVTDDLEMRRQEVRDFLIQAGFVVLSENWYRFGNEEAFNAALDDRLAQSSVFVQLLSPVLGKQPFDQHLGVPELQYRRALAGGRPILQWRDPTLNATAVEGSQHHDLLSATTVRAECLEDFKRAIVRALEPPPPPPPPPTAGKFVFISADHADRARAELMVKGPGWDPRVGYAMAPADGDPASWRQFFEVAVSNCDAAVVMYCGAEPASVLSQLMQCRKVLARREPPLPALAIYDGPPPPDEKAALAIVLPELRHLDCRAGPDALETFLRNL